MAQLFAGTSGFAYPTWKPDFYPEKLARKKFLNYYATRLNTVEINYTFRRLPSASTLEGWIADTPPGFVFVTKAHQRITHFDRLEVTEFSQVFFKAIDVLRIRKKLGPVLFQLPPGFKCDTAVLSEFVGELPDGIRYAFEFRHASWLTDAVYELLRRRNVALCLADSEKLVIPEVLTAPFVYSRLRKDDYTPEERVDIAARAQGLLAGGRDAYVFFKHEDTPAGAIYAEELLRGGG